MKVRIRLFFAALAFITGLSLAGTLVAAQDATPAAEIGTPASEEDCAGIGEYVRLLVDLGAGFVASSQGLDPDQVSTWTDEQYERIVSFLSSAIEQLTGLTPPEVARRFNVYAVSAIQTIQGVLIIVRETGLEQSLPFGDQLDQLDEGLTSVISALEEACPDIATPESGTPASG